MAVHNEEKVTSDTIKQDNAIAMDKTRAIMTPPEAGLGRQGADMGPQYGDLGPRMGTGGAGLGVPMEGPRNEAEHMAAVKQALQEGRITPEQLNPAEIAWLQQQNEAQYNMAQGAGW